MTENKFAVKSPWNQDKKIVVWNKKVNNLLKKTSQQTTSKKLKDLIYAETELVNETIVLWKLKISIEKIGKTNKEKKNREY